MKLLFVNDNDGVLEAYQAMLKALAPDIAVTASEDGNTALRVYRKGRYDLVLTDLDHPGLNGVELAEQILQANPQQRIGFVTVWAPWRNDELRKKRRSDETEIDRKLTDAYLQMEKFINRTHIPVLSIPVEAEDFVKFVRHVAS